MVGNFVIILSLVLWACIGLGALISGRLVFTGRMGRPIKTLEGWRARAIGAALVLLEMVVISVVLFET